MPKLRLAARDPELAGLRVVIVGLGRSGLAAARLAARRGARVTVTDRRAAADLGPAVEAVRGLGAEVRAGGDHAELAGEADLIVTSPGVPPGNPLLAGARAAGLPVMGETELAARFCRGRVVGITGSNGKSTVTTMIGGVLEQAGLSSAVGGNLDTPLSDLLARGGETTVYVLELSSFQLETLESLHAEIALVLNLSPDHLDRHSTLDDYAMAKARLLELQDVTGQAILNADDPASQRFRSSVRGRLSLFSVRGEVERGAFLRQGRLVLRTDHGEETLLGRDEIVLPGEHNAANALAAGLAARFVGCPAPAIAEGLRRYRPLPHRLEHVLTLDGIAFYNDSKATNPDAAARALAAFRPGSVVLILGGRDKGAAWDELVALIPRFAKSVLLVGESGPVLERRLRGSKVPITACGTVRRAVIEGRSMAAEGEVVLLAPGCASFDQYRNFEERGEDFRRAVRELAGPERKDA